MAGKRLERLEEPLKVVETVDFMGFSWIFMKVSWVFMGFRAISRRERASKGPQVAGRMLSFLGWCLQVDMEPL